jgi:hypothetical protein
MKTFVFSYFGDSWDSEIEADATEEEIEDMKQAIRDGFDVLEDVYMDLDDLRERIMAKIRDIYDNADDLGIQICFPESIVEEVEAEDDL